MIEDYTRHFKARMVVAMHLPGVSSGERVMSWILLHSWGRGTPYAVCDDGRAALASDCALALKLDEQRIADHLAFFKQFGFLKDQGKFLEPTIRPLVCSKHEEEWNLERNVLADHFAESLNRRERLDLTQSAYEKLWFHSPTREEPA